MNPFKLWIKRARESTDAKLREHSARMANKVEQCKADQRLKKCLDCSIKRYCTIKRYEQ
jgi:hypothetical protein